MVGEVVLLGRQSKRQQDFFCAFGANPPVPPPVLALPKEASDSK